MEPIWTYPPIEKLTIYLPANLNLYNAIEFCKSLSKQPMAQQIIFDCSALNHVEPFTMCYVAKAIRTFIAFRPFTQFFVRDMTNSYARHMNFFSAAGLADHQNKTVSKNPRYQAITQVNCLQLKDDAYNLGIHPCDQVKVDAERIASILAQSDNSKVYRFLQFAIQEMMRNVIEHSDSETLMYAGQLWPSKDKVEIAILDAGVGLKKSLEKNPKYSDLAETDAIHLAMTPGVSATEYGKGGPKGNWSNSGYGLYMTSRLCSEGGAFTLKSGMFGIHKENGKSDLFQGHMMGTGVRMILKPSRLDKLDESLEQYREDALTISKGLNSHLVGISPSTFLKTLKR